MFPICFGDCPVQELVIDLRVMEKPLEVELEVMEQDIVVSLLAFRTSRPQHNCQLLISGETGSHTLRSQRLQYSEVVAEDLHTAEQCLQDQLRDRLGPTAPQGAAPGAWMEPVFL